MGCCQQIRGSRVPENNTINSKQKIVVDRVRRDTFVKKKCSSRMQDYEILEKLGSGAFGTVMKARDKHTGQLRAIKSIEKSRMKLDRIYQEIEILKSLDHPNIVQIFEFIEEEETFYIVMELCTGKNLFKKILSLPAFTEKEAASYISQILSATVHCHERGIIHRDIKPENILFETDAENSLIKIIDFGLSNRIVKDDKLTELSGTPYFIAPEVIQRRYDEKSDLWSIGIVLYILLSGKVPFYGGDTKSLFNDISHSTVQFRPEDWNGISKEAVQFLKCLLQKKPADRISAAEALAHQWIRSKASKNVKDRNLNTDVLRRLQIFQTRQKLRQAVLTYISSHLTASSEVQMLREIFVQLDNNSDGKISKPELLQAFRILKLGGEKEVSEIMTRCDIDCDGFIDHSEFITAATNWEKALTRDNLLATFKELDSSKTGVLSVEDFKKLIGEDVDFIEELIKEADTNRDGTIDLNEFLSCVLEDNS